MNKILIIVNLLLVIVFINLYLLNFAYPNTYLSRFNLSGKSKKEIKKIIDPAVYANQAINLKVKNRIYKIRIADIGIFLDQPVTTNIIFENNNNFFPSNFSAFIRSFHSHRLLLPTILFTQNFYNFTQNTVFDFSVKENDIVVDNQNKKIDFKDYEERYNIDPESFKKQIVFNFGEKNITIEPRLNKIDNDMGKKTIITEYNERLNRAFNQSIDIIINNDSNQRISIPTTEIKKILNIDYDKQTDKVNFTINDLFFNSFILPKIKPYSIDDKKVDITMLKNNLLSLVNSRFDGIKSDIIIANINIGPNTAGDVSQKYIEVDISQQNMYLYENKKMVGTYKISSGLYYPTPVGQFKILNKAINAFSDIYHVWMPFWMAFAYDTKLNAYFGIHELPYWISGDGNKIQRPRDFIGSPHTGGCISLDIGAANEVYNFAEVNMPVYIFD